MSRKNPTPPIEKARFHATAVAMDGKGIMLMADSGGGKSDLALRLIDRGACLIADDQVWLEEKAGELRLFPPPNLKGLMEVRELGIINLPWCEDVPLFLIIQLTKDTERLPEDCKTVILSREICTLRLNPFTEAAAFKVELFVRRLLDERK